MVNKSNSHRWKVFIPVIIAGFIVVLILLFSYNKGIQMTAKYAPLVDAAMEIKLEATNAHLILEEILSSDRHEDIEAVWKHIDMADWYAKAMLEGGQNPEGTFLPLEEEEMRRNIINVRKKLAEFRTASQKRFEEKEISAAGTEIYQQYHVILDKFIQQADIVETMLQRLIIKDLQQFRITQIILIIATILLTILVGILLNRYERRKSENIYELENLNKLLQDEITERKQKEEKLKAANQQLIASEQQLKAANQQLRANELQLKAANQQLIASEQQLKAANQQLIASEQEIKKHAHNLGERVKELQCLYGVSESIQKRTTLEEIFHDVVKLIPPGWHYPEITRGRIEFDGKEYVSHAFKEYKWKQSADIIVSGKVRGSIEVYYLEERPELDEGPFMKEERNLIDGMAKTISETIERKRAEEAIRQYVHIVSSSSDMLALLDKEFNYLAANEAYMEAFNLSPEELIGKKVAMVFGEEFFNTVVKPNADRCLGGEEVNYQDWFDFPAYERRFMDITYYPYYSEDYKIVGFAVNGRNITERKQVEEALKESEIKWRSLAMNSPDHILLLDKELNIQFINYTVPDLTNEEVIGTSISKYVPEKFWPVMEKCFDRVWKTGEPDRYEMEYESRDGSFKTYFEGRVRAIIKDDEIASLIINASDITERKQAEEKLKSRHKELQTFYDAAVGRELKVIELKKEINELLEKSGEKPKYEIPV